ncbi:MAG: copper amine oxidase N-terminal domain-containing protein [bacterium]
MQARGLFALLLTVLLSASLVTVPVLGQGAVRVFVDGEQVLFDQPPVVQGSRVLVPVRGVFEKMGATVEWHPSTRTVLAARTNTLVELKIGSRIARVNDRPVTLDVPATILRGRTLVPLRFISESLGASVEYREESRTVVISTTGAPVGQPPPPPTAGQTIKGVITDIRPAQQAGDQSRIVIESGNVAYTITINVDTAVTRVNVSSNVGGSVGVAALRRGDDAEVTFTNNVATRIRATYMETIGRIDQIAKSGRTIILTDGRTIRYVSNVVVTRNGQPAQGGADALQASQVLDPLRLNPTSREAWEINIVSGAAQMPPSGQMILNIREPDPGATVGNPFTVRGRTAARSQVVATVTFFLGFPVGSQTVTANSEGQFTMRVPVTLIAPNTPHNLTVTATHSDLGQEQRSFTITVK